MRQDRKEAEAILKKGALRLGLQLDDQQAAQFMVYLGQLKHWSRRINLTSITDNQAIIERHFLDSLVGSIAFQSHEGLRLLDIGTGAGFPGIPLKLYRPEIQLTLVESVHKKTAFLHQLCGALKLQGVWVLPERIEALHHRPEYQGTYEIVVARALAKPQLTWEMAAPMLTTGGRILIYATPAAAKGLQSIQGWRLKPFDYELPFSRLKRSIMTMNRA